MIVCLCASTKTYLTQRNYRFFSCKRCHEEVILHACRWRWRVCLRYFNSSTRMLNLFMVFRINAIFNLYLQDIFFNSGYLMSESSDNLLNHSKHNGKSASFFAAYWWNRYTVERMLGDKSWSIDFFADIRVFAFVFNEIAMRPIFVC